MGEIRSVAELQAFVGSVLVWSQDLGNHQVGSVTLIRLEVEREITSNLAPCVSSGLSTSQDGARHCDRGSIFLSPFTTSSHKCHLRPFPHSPSRTCSPAASPPGTLHSENTRRKRASSSRSRSASSDTSSRIGYSYQREVDRWGTSALSC